MELTKYQTADAQFGLLNGGSTTGPVADSALKQILRDWELYQMVNNTDSPQDKALHNTQWNNVKWMISQLANAAFDKDQTRSAKVTGSANSIVLTTTDAYTYYAVGDRFLFSPLADNTASVSVNINGINGAIIKKDGINLIAKDLRANGLYIMIYDGTNFNHYTIGGVSPVEGVINPTVNDDSSLGYDIGQTWVNSATSDIFTLVDNTVGVAVWKKLDIIHPVVVASDPTITDDTTHGYVVGQTWVNTTTNAFFTLVDNTTGAAIWQGMANSAAVEGTAPLATSDDNNGYQTGQIWIDTVNGKSYVCVDNTTGAAIWEQLDLILPVVLASSPTTTDDASSGYLIGQRWINTTTRQTYVLVDNAIGSAIWNEEAIGPRLSNVVPTVNDDSSLSYKIGQLWVDTVTDKSFILVDDTVGAAVWKEFALTPKVNIITASSELKLITDAPLNTITTATALTLTLPVSATTGDLIVLNDGLGNAQLFPITLDNGGNTIDGANDIFVLDVNGFDITLTKNANDWILGGR